MATEISLPLDSTVTSISVLYAELSALKLILTGNGKAIPGAIVHLPTGSEIQGFGQCFDRQSLLVRVTGDFYIVFKEDLEKATIRSRAQEA